ncbi:MAG TPA: AtzE family amidohydrolase [Stellaceae bacterium]|nr:AtzE family amidohydrolase [Stellaceae bacterium]
MMTAKPGALGIADAVRRGAVSAREVTEAALTRIEAGNPRLNAFTAVTADRARGEAAAIDAKRARGEALGPLGGVPYAVKNLFDVAGLTTLAGSKIDAENPPAKADATAVRRLREAGAVLVGALNMDEYAYGFTTENTHYGPTRNPHDPARVAGGSSGGSAAAVAGGLVPLTLGTDTNGSIRLPASLCGIFGLKPTYGRLSRAGAKLFVGSLDHVGPFARSVRDLAACYDALQGADAADPVCQAIAAEPSLEQLDKGIDGLRVAIAGGYFAPAGTEEAQAAVAAVAKALRASRVVELPEVARARAAAFVITNAESANLHLANLKRRAADFDPAMRDRFLAGALVPATWVLQAQRFRRWYRERMLELFATCDIVLAPATPCPAPLIGQDTMMLGGREVATRPHLGLFTQPLSFIGLPVVAVPVRRPGELPIGVQIVAAPWRETAALRVAAALERDGVVAAPVPAG